MNDKPAQPTRRQRWATRRQARSIETAHDAQVAVHGGSHSKAAKAERKGKGSKGAKKGHGAHVQTADSASEGEGETSPEAPITERQATKDEPG